MVKDAEVLTPSQEKALEAIRREAEAHTSGEGKVSEFDVRPVGPKTKPYSTIMVDVIVEPTGKGTVGSETPYRGQFFVGRRGKIQIAGVRTLPWGRRTRARKHPLVYGWRKPENGDSTTNGK